MLRQVRNKIFTAVSLLKPTVDSSLGAILNRWEIARIRNLRRRTPSTVTLFRKEISFPDGYWFLHSMEEIFCDEVYKFQSTKENPLIIDCGANIGLSVIYFKRLYPMSRIIAFEPDISLFERLKANIAGFNYQDVRLLRKGLWKTETTLSFLAEGTLGGRVIEGPSGSSRSDVISIDTVRLKDYLTDEVDFLKIDIEGAEYEVLLDCADSLKNVHFLFVEYHSTASESQKLDQVLSLISSSGFRYYIREASQNLKHPFVDKNQNWFDLQLNIFCFRS